MSRFRLVWIISGVFWCFWPAASTRATESVVVLVPAVEGLEQPVYVTHAGDGSGRLFVVEQAGRIMIVRHGAREPKPFLDIRDRVASGGELGLLSVAFHPQYADNGRLFVDYTARDRGQLKTIIAEYRVDAQQPDVADHRERVLLEIAQPFANHNGGQLQFGPDGDLYIGMGDGGGAGDPFQHGQNLQTLLGKILRIDVDHGDPYAIPPENPFVNGAAAPEIWAYGLRNPWRFSFDRQTGRLFAADVGQNSYEEIDVIERGGNYGWNIMEGSHCFPPESEACTGQGTVLPIAEYGHAEGISVTGGYVYRGQAMSSLEGVYIFGDFGSSRVWALTQTSPGRWSRRLLAQAREPISSFGEDQDGELYLVGYGGTLFRLAEEPLGSSE